MGKEVGSPGGSDGVSESVVEVDVPISEEVIWKNRAMEAEERVAVLEARVVELEGDVASAHESVRTVERRGEIDRELVAAKAIDLETARLLTEATIRGMDAPDVAVAVRDLCDRKPFLFARRSGLRGGLTMGASVGSGGVDEELESMADCARTSGDRGDLLRYLRVRRGH